MSSVAQSPAARANRIGAQPERSAPTRLKGHVPAWARPAADTGAVADATPLHVTFILARDPETQAAFTQLLADQQDPASPRFHQWLTPAQMGELYGPTQHDVDAFTAWLTGQGFAVADVSPSRTFITTSASAGAVANALATGFHTFTLNGESRIAPMAEPALPADFAAIVGSIAGLADIPAYPMSHGVGMAEAASDPLGPALPRLTTGTSHFVTPGDFATIFDLKSAYSAGYNGAGQKIAIIGRSRVVATDVSAYLAKTGVAAGVWNTIVPPTGIDPGFAGGGDQSEATLDVQRVAGTAPGAQIDLVIATSASGGIYSAAQYAVNTLKDPIMNISFGNCEINAGLSGVNQWDSLFSVAAGLGISVFVSSADSGADTCDTSFVAAPSAQALSINYICASTYATCVGGTEFADTASPSTYWSSTNSSTLSSALSYIPEGAWNEPVGSTGYIVAASGGGVSTYIPSPSWQSGTGVPTTAFRVVPDMSFPASAHDGYYGCYALGNGDCNAGYFEYFEGTSAAAPSMASVVAILNQKLGKSQGNMNPTLYRLAATPANGVFHDVTVASSGVTGCVITTPSMCNNSDPSPLALTGGLAGYLVGTGYDQVTGWGSIDVGNLLTALSTGKSATTTALTASTTTITTVQTVVFTATIAGTGSGTPTGTVQFYSNGSALGAAIAVSGGKSVTAALSFPTAGYYTITATYSGDANFATSTGGPLTLTDNLVTRFASTTAIVGTATTITTAGTAGYTATITGTGSSATPTGTVQFYSGSTALGAPVTLAAGKATLTPQPFTTAGTYSITAVYAGDTTFLTSTSAGASLVVTVPPGFTIAAAPATLTLTAGASTGNTSTLTYTSTGGFAGTITQSCTVAYNGNATPNLAPTCTFSPATVALAAAGTATGTITLGSTATKAVPGGAAAANRTPGNLVRFGSGIALGALLLLALPGRNRRRALGGSVTLALALTFALFATSGCGGSSGSASTTPVVAGTTTGSYTVTLTSSSGTTLANTTSTIALTIQ